MSDNEPTVTQEKGPEGNLYETLPLEWKYTAEVKKEARAEAASKGPDVNAVAKAKDAVDAGAAAVDHGKAQGAANALTFHNWDKKEGE